MKTQLLITLLATLLVGCGTAPLENTSGGYHAVAPYYTTQRGVLFATDGEHTYWLQRAEVAAGDVRGAAVGLPECWRRSGADDTRCYTRTPSTFRDQSKQPVFIAY